MAAACLCGGVGFSVVGNNGMVSANADVVATTIDAVTLTMKNGASVRYVDSKTESGIRFSMNLSNKDYLGLEANEGDAYQSVSYGMAIMPYTYLDTYGDLTQENLFGENAKYDWAQWNGSEWVYSGDNTTKKRITVLSNDTMVVDKDGGYVMHGTIADVLYNNLVKDFVGRGYIKVVNADGSVEYLMADYTEGNVHNNVRSIVEVAEKAIADPELTDQTKIDRLTDNYLDATTLRSVKFYDGEYLLETYQTKKNYVFADAVALDGVGAEFDHWEDENGNTVVPNGEYEITATTKLYAVYSGITEAVAATQNEIDTFLGMSVTQGTLTAAQNQYQTVKSALDALRADDYNELVAVNGENINAKVEEINTLLDTASDLYLQYEGTLFEGDALVNGVSIQQADGTKPFSVGASSLITNGVQADPSSSGQKTWEITLPKIDYSDFISVHFEWQTSATGSSLYVENGNGIAWNYSYTAGNVDITNNGDGTITVVVSETGGTSGSTTVSDSAIVGGTQGLKLCSKLEAYRQLALGPITATSFYDVWSVEGNATLYSGDALKNNVTGSNDSTGAAATVSTGLVDGTKGYENGINVDFGNTQNVALTINLPKIDYTAYDTVSMGWCATDSFTSLGVKGSGTKIAASWSYTPNGTITIKNNGNNTVDVVITDTSSSSTATATVSDSAIVNGESPLQLETYTWSYRRVCLSEITGSRDFDARMEVAKEAGKQPKTVSTTLYEGDAFKNATTYSCDSDSSKTMNFHSGAYSDSEGWSDGICFDVSGSGGLTWTINFPAIDYAAYTKLSFEWCSSDYTGFGVQGGDFIAQSSTAYAGTVVIQNNGDNTITVTVTETATGKTSVATMDINATVQFKMMCSAYRRICFSKVTAEYAVKASNMEGISLAEKEFVLSAPYIFTAENVLYGGQDLIDNVSIMKGGEVDTSVTINHYNAFFSNAVQFDPGAGNTADRVIALPLIAYADYETVSMEFKARNAAQTFGFVDGERLSDGGDDSNPFAGTITFTNNYDGTVTCVINATSTGGSISYTITDEDVLSGVSPMTFFWNNGNSYRQFLIGEITGYNGKISVSTVPTEYELTDFNASTYETTVYDVDATDRGALLVRPNGDGTLYMETQNADGSQTTENVYVISLPWIDFATVNYITTTFTTNNGTGIGFASDATIAVAESTELSVKTNVDDNGVITLTATLENSNGATVTSTIDDADIVNGYKGLPVYVKGIQYTQYAMSNIIANGKSSLVVRQEQALDLDVAGGASGYSEYRIAWNANDEWTTDYYNYEFAAQELASFLGRWTGETYQLVKMYDGSVIENDSKLIVLGGKLATDAGLTMDGIEKSNGYKIVQDHTNLYIYSPTSEGTLKGLYGFLEEQAGVTFYTDEVFTENVTENSVTVGAGTSITFNPSFNSAQAGYAEMQYSKEYQRRLGMYVDWDVMTGIALEGAATAWDKELVTSGHNMLDIFPYDSFASTYSDWYVKDDGGNWQLNFTSSNTHLQEMKDMLVASAKVVIANQTQYEYFEFAQPDSHYGPDTAGYLSFMNDVAATLDAWLAVEDPDRTVALVMYAYNDTNTAPSSGSIYNGNNVYVAVYFAPVGSRYPYKIDASDNYDKDTTENTFDTSATVYEKLLSWTKLEGFDKDRNLIYWMYGTDFYHYMLPMDTITNLQYNYQKLYETGTDMIKYQFQTKNKDNVGSDWQRLKTYLSAELAKNVNADVATLQANFMNAMYGAGASYMQQLLSAQQAYCTYDNFDDKDPLLHSNYTENYFGVINGSTKLMSSTYFTKDTLNTWMGYINKAKLAVNEDTSLSSDEEKTAMLNRIEVEALSIRYMLVSLHGVTTYDASVSAWKTHATSLGCYCYTENDDTDGNWE